MKNLIRTLFPILFLAPTLFFGQASIELRELIDSALVHDGALNEQILENQYTRLNDKKLKDLFLPKLEVSGKVGYLYSRLNFESPEISIPALNQVLPGLQIPAGYFDQLSLSGFSAGAKAQATMLIYSGGKVKYLKEANREKDLSEQVLMRKSRDEVITEVSKAYDQLALVQESKRVLEESKKRLEISKKTADKALGYGLITPYDHKKIELAQATLDSKMVEYEGKKRLLIAQIEQLTEMDPERIAQITPQLRPVDYAVLDTGIEDRAEIQALNHGIKAIEYKIKAEQRWWVPKVQTQTSLSYLGLYGAHIKSDNHLIPGSNQTLELQPSNLNVVPLFEAGVGFQWDILDGNQGKHAVEKAKIERRILETKRKEAVKKLRLNLANNQTQYEIANAQIALKEKAKELAESGLEQIEKEFRYGTKTSSALIEAQNDLENAELELKTAIFNQRRAAIELVKSTRNLEIDLL